MLIRIKQLIISKECFEWQLLDILMLKKGVCYHQYASAQTAEKHFYLIEWETNGEKCSNHYMTNICDIDYPEYIKYLEKSGYLYFDGFDC